MKPIAEALQHILSTVTAPGARLPHLPATETISLLTAQGRVLAQDIIAPLDVPPAANSAMDGYALHTRDLPLAASAGLLVSQRIAAGQVPAPLTAGTAARIFTGAEIPAGANSVVMQEQCELLESSDGQRVRIPVDLPANNNIRPRGQDIACGHRVLSEGRRLTPADLGLLASLGFSEVNVYRRLRVAILSTGDELAEPGTPLQPGQIYNSNRFLLAGFLQQMQIEAVDLGRIADTPQATRDALARAAREADCIISSGGVSVGEEDHVKTAVEALGQLSLWKLALKPGKPLAFGQIAGTPFFGLPGNPVAVFVTFLLCVRPYLYAQQGAAVHDPAPRLLAASFSRHKTALREEYVRVRLDPAGNMQTYPNQSSGALTSASWANALAIVAPGTTVSEGDLVPVLVLDSLFV